MFFFFALFRENMTEHLRPLVLVAEHTDARALSLIVLIFFSLSQKGWNDADRSEGEVS